MSKFEHILFWLAVTWIGAMIGGIAYFANDKPSSLPEPLPVKAPALIERCLIRVTHPGTPEFIVVPFASAEAGDAKLICGDSYRTFDGVKGCIEARAAYCARFSVPAATCAQAFKNSIVDCADMTDHALAVRR